MGGRKIKHFVIENRVEELTAMADRVMQLAQKWKLPPTLAMNMTLVMEEALSNIIFYAFPDKDKHEIKVSITLQNNLLTIKITDNGIAFNPLSQQQPDISLPAAERPVGGLGIFLISQIMDRMHYTRHNNQNILELTKTIGYEH